jgi:hypothetical protein
MAGLAGNLFWLQKILNHIQPLRGWIKRSPDSTGFTGGYSNLCLSGLGTMVKKMLNAN